MAKLDLDWLTVFDEVYKTSSVSRAAERLGMAQAAASIALNKLRDHFNDTLFSRTARGMQPTPRAQALYPDIREILDRLNSARNKLPTFEPSQATRMFRICMTDISEVVILPMLTNYLMSHAPKIRVVVEKISVDSARRLEDGVVDLAVGFMPQLEGGFFQQVLFEQTFVCIASKSHPRVLADMTPETFANEGHVVVTTSGTGHTIVDQVVDRNRICRNVALEVPSFLGVARIVAETELIATVPLKYGEVMQDREAIRLFPFPFDIPHYDVKQHWHERFHNDLGSTWLRRTISDLLRQEKAAFSHL